MTDHVFILQTIQKGEQAKEKVQKEFSGISSEQINWKPAPNSWSIAECLQHLIISDSSYFPALKKITTGNYQMTFWEKFSPFTRLWGSFFIKKMKAPRVFQPPAEKKDLQLLARYNENLDIFLGYIAKCEAIDLDRTIITSPAIGMVTYSLRDTLSFLIQHEHRHINQAIRIKTHAGFPK
jgi:uncharacterized damage-inducible protein DinB